MASERNGIPIGWVIDGANRSDITLLDPTLEAVAGKALLEGIDTIHLDRAYYFPVMYRRLTELGIPNIDIEKRGTKRPGGGRQPLSLGLRWIVEVTNAWWSNYGQLRRNTDRQNRYRHAALCLATTILIIGRLIDDRDRTEPL